MQITVELPKDIAQRPDPAREALEALAIEGYRSGIPAVSPFVAAAANAEIGEPLDCDLSALAGGLCGPRVPDARLAGLDPGERDAILLALP